MKKIVKYWLPVFIWAGFIFYLSSIPNLKANSDPAWDEFIRNLLHMFFYFVLSVLVWRALRFLKGTKRRLMVLLFVFVYSFMDEIHQHFVPTRTFQMLDLLIDNLGSYLAVFLVWKLLPRMPKKLGDLIK